MIQMILIKEEGVFPGSVLLFSPVGLEQSVHQSRSAAGAGCLLGGLEFVLIESKKKKYCLTHGMCHLTVDKKPQISDSWDGRKTMAGSAESSS